MEGINKKYAFRLKLMYWYNILVTGGFTCIILLVTFFPGLRNLFAWQGTDPIIGSLVIPLFFVMAFFCIIFLSKPEQGILLLKIQVFYKPIAAILIGYYTLMKKIHPFWAIIIIIGLLGYIIGNTWAIPWKRQNTQQ